MTSKQTERASLRESKRIIVKVGSRLLSESPAGCPATIADQISDRRDEQNFVVVSSGAISLGMRALGMKDRPADMPSLQSAAAVGQSALLQNWEHAFSAHGITIAQILLTHDDISDRRRFLNARQTLRALLDRKVIPIVNENDTVAVHEIKYGDNDFLAALLGNLISADAVILLTDVDGLHGDDGERIPIVRNIEAEAEPVAGGSQGDGIGSGGMASKVQAAKIAVRHGIPTIIAPGRENNIVTRILAGDDIGTLFVPTSSQISSRKHWIAYGASPVGGITVDAGAHRAICEGGGSLLPAGVVKIQGEFGLGDTVSLHTENGAEFARGLAGYPAKDLNIIKGSQSADIEAKLGYKYLDAIIHRDDLVLL